MIAARFFYFYFLRFILFCCPLLVSGLFSARLTFTSVLKHISLHIVLDCSYFFITCFILIELKQFYLIPSLPISFCYFTFLCSLVWCQIIIVLFFCFETSQFRYCHIKQTQNKQTRNQTKYINHFQIRMCSKYF